MSTCDIGSLVRDVEGGTLFLDEISSASLNLQKKLLGLPQERQYRRVGDSETPPADVRIIAASNHNLPGLVLERKFREDLYYRLNVMKITIPPLGEPYGCPGNSELQTLNEMTQDSRLQCIIKPLNRADVKVQDVA